jgi:acyl-[acyl-carrier-protein] desaturase
VTAVDSAPSAIAVRPAPARPPIDPGSMAGIVELSVRRQCRRQWSIDDLNWAGLRPERLNEADRSAVRFITLIEDHIPGYLSFFLQTFPTTGADQAIEEFCFNREYFRFLIAWASDEERHAAVLTRYQLEAGLSTRGELITTLAQAGRTSFSLPYEHPVQAFAYTLIQEKATQLFYQRFKAVVTEPVLRELLNLLARDEARHYAFYVDLLTAYLRRHGPKATVPDLREVLATFRMPLADTLDGYWRWSLRVADHAGYDHTEAYEALARLIRQFAAGPGNASATDLIAFVHAISAVAPR